MGLLTQAFAGALEGAGTTGAALMTKDYEAQLQAQRDAAQALRDQNLENLRAANTATAADTAFNRIGAGRQAEQMNSLSSSLVNGAPATNQDIADAVAGNADIQKNTGMIQQSINDRLAAVQAAQSNPNPSEDDLNNIQAQGDVDPATGQSQIDALNAGTKTISNPSLDMKQAQMDMQQKIQDAKNETLLEKAKMYTDMGTYKADTMLKAAQERLEWAKSNGLSGAIKESQIAVQKAEEERKNATAAQKLATEGDFSKPETVALYNKFLDGAGMSDFAKPMPVAPVAPVEEPGLMDRLFSKTPTKATGPAPGAILATKTIGNKPYFQDSKGNWFESDM
jgi:O-acetyl-ADP-ribose deacetylase (regulator of RNase III)